MNIKITIMGPRMLKAHKSDVVHLERLVSYVSFPLLKAGLSAADLNVSATSA